MPLVFVNSEDGLLFRLRPGATRGITVLVPANADLWHSLFIIILLLTSLARAVLQGSFTKLL